MESVTDTLILWALEGTDPDQGIKMTQAEILAKIATAVPAAVHEIGWKLEIRLKALSSKNTEGGRRINFHRAETAYVLPYETRKLIQEANANDELLAIRVREGLIQRAREASETQLSDTDAELMGDVAIRKMHITFENQGLMFSHFLANEEEQDSEHLALADAAKTALFERGVSGQRELNLAVTAIRVARRCLYGSTSDEREYLRRLARTYTLLFTLRNEPKVIDFFAQMASDFYLYVGSDMIVRALSERFLEPADQLCRNMLVMGAEAGMEMIHGASAT